MSGHDKYRAVEGLKAQGWTEDTESGKYMLRPPRTLLDKLASMAFYVYDARDLQAFVPTPEDDEKPRHPSMKPFKCPVCRSPYFGPLWEGGEHVGRYCKGWPSGCDRSYDPCRGKHEERFDAPNTNNERAEGSARQESST